jgi:polyferredoxin
MNRDSLYRLAADAVLITHVAVVMFVVAGLVLVIAGNVRGWSWVNGWWFRIAHVLAIAIVIAQAWLGVVCPLTTLENWLRAQGGGTAYGESFVAHWLQRLLFYDAPAWLFTAAYTVFGVAVIAAWWRFPPRTAQPAPRGPRA